ncbi:hypothetical protein WR25_00953 [Diploscapter pachys]|uniref:Uncharacterized protein n=1 Tax=Diploscapter pachys TaxID=2018661 RepID=A0A2A2L9I9_9BILA|nr:hypothetical protein WR25_00953 [Diploscapter pachys]
MCKPSEMAEHHFDPTSCKADDYKNFLSCATNNGTRSHVHCCKTQLVPSFCYDFCSGDFTTLRRAHRLCLYYLPEIFECYNRAYLPYPDPPQNVTVNAVEHDKLSVCWQAPEIHDSNKDYPVLNYSVFYKEIPNFPLLGGDLGVPLLSGDYSDIGDLDDSEYSDESPSTEPPVGRSSADRTKRSPKPYEINTTEKCATISDLRSATRYTIYVIARSAFGASVPSVRSIATTNPHVVSNNESLPDSNQCCSTNGVDPYCASKMCQVNEDPSSFATISIATTCRQEWPKVAPCIADNRNHTACCVRKGVQSECLKICSGSTEPLSPHAVLCLNLDLQAIYQCLREGYETHPSAPINVAVNDVTESSATITWEEPIVNAHLVETYTLHIRKSEHGAPVRQVHNAVSPHMEIGLDSDSEYTVSVQSHSDKGESLPSTAIIFRTLSSFSGPICSIGEPLLVSEGRPFLCNALNRCPTGFSCTEVDGNSYCCQNDEMHSDHNFQMCCAEQKVSEKCMPSCYYNTTFPPECTADLNKWVQCASEGQDHLRCCAQEGVSKECQTGCKHPFQVPDTCFHEVQLLQRCFAGVHEHLPGAVRVVEITQVTQTTATVSWDDLESDITYYKVELFSNDLLINSTNTTVDVQHYENLMPQTEYKVRVAAADDEQMPLAPDGIRIDWNHGSRVNLTWNKVTQKLNGQNITSPVSYTLHWVDSESSKEWNNTQTNNTWFVLFDLKEDAFYNAYVTATVDGKQSQGSSIITLLAQWASLTLPEPRITITPEHENYIIGQNITVNCSISAHEKDNGHINVDLTVGTHFSQNDHGSKFVTINKNVEESMDTVTCTVSDTDGRQNVAMRKIRINSGPSAKMVQKPGDAGIYTCIAELDGNTSNATAELIMHEDKLPVNPRQIISCCEDQKIEGDCLEACSIGRVMKLSSCKQYATKLLKCASDTRDHSDCCVSQGIPQKCLPLCSGDSLSDDNSDCSQYAVQIMGCHVRGHEKAPSAVKNAQFTIQGPGRIRIEWDDPHADGYLYHAVYYRVRDSDDSANYTKTNTNNNFLDLNLDPEKEYDVAVVAANVRGHSPYVFLDVPTTFDAAPGTSGSPDRGSSSFFYIFMILLLMGSIIVGIFLLARRKDLPAPFGKLVGRNSVPTNHPSVAFENPAYGNEVEIRGLGEFGRSVNGGLNSEWQQADLRPSSQDDNGNNNYRNGTGYAKLNT